MQVLYGLSAVFAAVVDDAIAVRETFCRRNLLCDREDMCDDLRVFFRKVICGSDVLLWNHQNVHRRLRVEVAECEHFVVFVDLRARNLAVGNLAKMQSICLSPFLRFYIERIERT